MTSYTDSPQSCEVWIAPDHPAFAGHFPGRPMLPGAALLDAALHEIARMRQIDLVAWRVASAKFLQVVAPATLLTVEHSAPAANSIRFVMRCADTTVVSGTLAAMEASRGA